MYMCFFWKTPVDIHDISMMGFYRDETDSRFSSIMRKQRSPLATSWFLKIGGLQNFGFRPSGCCTVTFLGPRVYGMDSAKGSGFCVGFSPSQANPIP